MQVFLFRRLRRYDLYVETAKREVKWDFSIGESWTGTDGTSDRAAMGETPLQQACMMFIALMAGVHRPQMSLGPR